MKFFTLIILYLGFLISKAISQANSEACVKTGYLLIDVELPTNIKDVNIQNPCLIREFTSFNSKDLVERIANNSEKLSRIFILLKNTGKNYDVVGNLELIAERYGKSTNYLIIP